MISAAALLEVAKAVLVDGASPTALSRATSTAYYALFHALLEEARARVAGCTNNELLRRYAAGFGHMEIAQAAKHVIGCNDPTRRQSLKTSKPAEWTTLFPPSENDPDKREPSPMLLEVCDTFIEMQALRHAADYDPLWEVNLEDATQYVADAEKALSAWRACCDSGESLIFLFGARGLFMFR